MDVVKTGQSVSRLDNWLQSMRSADGYSGPVVHWWQSCLQYSGPMLDWRYEGIICGYLSLYEASNDPLWLKRAMDAGDDLCKGQLPSGMFRNSSFEIGPIEGGTPHEAAADVGLLELASVLRAENDHRWERYFACAERNLRDYQLRRLWGGDAFLDQAWNTTRVANKNATTLEALLLYEQLIGHSMEQYVRGAADLILSAQVLTDGPFHGATVHLGTGKQRLMIGIYTARCASALLRLYKQYPDERYLRSARAMGGFLMRSIRSNGTTFGYYPDGREIVNPTWVSPAGDVLRALLLLRPYMCVPGCDIQTLEVAIERQQQPTGGIPTALGLGRKGGTRPFKGPPDFRDVLPVAGWVDKSFRALTLMLTDCKLARIVPEPFGETDVLCTWKGKLCRYRETSDVIRLDHAHTGTSMYLWEKGQHYPLVFEL
jgi:hypothetical protein